MGIVYSAMVAAAPNNSAVATILKPINMAVNTYHWLMTPVYKIWGSDLIQRAINDALEANNVYSKYIFPYVMFGTFLLAAFGPQNQAWSKKFLSMQMRMQIDGELEKNPKFEHRYAELQGLV